MPCWHLLAAAARVRRGATAAGRPLFGERQAGTAVALTRQALRQLESLAPTDRRGEIRRVLGRAVTLDAQLVLFAPVLPYPPGSRRLPV